MKGVARVAKLDAAMNRQFDATYGLKGYPQVVLIPAGKHLTMVGPKDKKVYYVHEGARTADALEEWALEKIKQNKGFLVERLTSEAKWQEYCIDLQISLCVIVFLPNAMDSSDEERRVYLEIIRGVP